MGRQIKTKPDRFADTVRLGGWFDGKGTYLWIGDEKGECIGTLSNQKLYRLAKAIIKQFESED